MTIKQVIEAAEVAADAAGLREPCPDGWSHNCDLYIQGFNAGAHWQREQAFGPAKAPPKFYFENEDDR